MLQLQTLKQIRHNPGGNCYEEMDIMTTPTTYTTVDQYIELQPKNVQAVLKRIRKLAKKAAPNAKELISYKMPALKGHGILIYYAAWKEHIGLYPPISGDKEIQAEVKPFAGPKGNLQFPLDETIPYDLIERIVRLRVEQDDAKKAASKKRKKA